MTPPGNREIDLLSHEFFEAGPQETYTWMRQNAPVYWDATNEIWGISRHEDIELRCMFDSVLRKFPQLERAESGPLKISAPAFDCGLSSLPVRVLAA